MYIYVCFYEIVYVYSHYYLQEVILSLAAPNQIRPTASSPTSLHIHRLWSSLNIFFWSAPPPRNSRLSPVSTMTPAPEMDTGKSGPSVQERESKWKYSTLFSQERSLRPCPFNPLKNIYFLPLIHLFDTKFELVRAQFWRS